MTNFYEKISRGALVWTAASLMATVCVAPARAQDNLLQTPAVGDAGGATQRTGSLEEAQAAFMTDIALVAEARGWTLEQAVTHRAISDESFGLTAYGSHKGGCTINNVSRNVFSVADLYDEALGVTVRTN